MNVSGAGGLGLLVDSTSMPSNSGLRVDKSQVMKQQKMCDTVAEVGDVSNTRAVRIVFMAINTVRARSPA